ncbi:MAG: hypothetical protein HXS48_16280 [Theionarchaea archaeon]|nr:MAG: hypothetical protein AYK19_20425 [Theionarchaea archaeon DG-70-1]MBU7028492.1 hypothetical protein [Theionarchaea archaeon]
MYEKDKETAIFDIRAIEGVKDRVERYANQAFKNLDDALQKIGDALLFNVELVHNDVNASRIDHAKNDMVINASALMKKEEKLVKNIVELVGILCKFVKTAYKVEELEPDVIPTSLIRMGRHWKFLSVGTSQSAMTSNKLAMLSGYKKSESNPMIENCCELAIGACTMGKYAITKNVWEGLPENSHPDGMIGHTYNVLRAYDSKRPRTAVAKDFRTKFQEKADEYRQTVSHLIDEIQNQTPQPGQAVKYLGKALEKLEEASKLVQEASKYIEKLPPKPSVAITNPQD